MSFTITSCAMLALAALPFIYYLLALYGAWAFFRPSRAESSKHRNFAPPISILKPVRGLDPDAYENFASFCRQDYPEYEIVFCVGTTDDPVLPIIDELKRDFPGRDIRVLFGSGRIAANDKVAKLARLASEARYEHLVISDSDVRVRPDYLRSIIVPLADPNVGAVTCLYVSTGEKSTVENIQSTGMISDFYAGLFVARQLDGVKFALGPTIATTRARLAAFGGYQTIENRPADDLLVGRLIAEQGYEIELSRYAIETVADYQSIRELIHKRMRWLVVMRHMRPWGHVGLLFTQGLLGCFVAVAAEPTLAVASVYFGIYLALRFAMAWTIGIWGLKQRGFWKNLPLVPLWDALALAMWVSSFARSTIRWRGGDYYIRKGILVPATAQPSDH
jgi:ceramide glucosyltransferase